jgi:4-amino-4-deoxy-L-arabinose transferase-like glycosyltransferase
MQLGRSTAISWGLFLAAALAWRLLFFVGPQASDDGAYSAHADSILRGAFHPAPDIFSSRIGYLLCIAGSYAFLGAGAFSLILPSLLFSLAGIVLAYAVAREYLDEPGARRAAALTALLPLDVFFATEAHTDLPLAVLFSAAVLLFLRAKKSEGVRGFLLCGVVVGVAQLFKESAFFAFAGLAALTGRPRPREAWTFAGYGAVAALELLYYLAATGDPLYRIHTVSRFQDAAIAEFYRSDVSSLSTIGEALGQLVSPLSAGFPAFGLLPPLAFAGAAVVLAKKDPALRPVVFWTAALILLLVFWPIRLFPYRPALRSHARIFLIAELPLAILASSFLGSLRRTPRIALLAAFGAAAVTGQVALHADARRLTEGARLAYARIPEGEPVVSDPRTIYLFRVYDGYRDRRPLLDYTQPAPPGPHVRVVNETWLRRSRDWYGQEPPAGFERPTPAPIFTGTIPGRRHLRSLLRGHAEPPAADEVRVYRIP